MTMAATLRTSTGFRTAKGNRYAPGRTPSGRRLRPGLALLWLLGIAASVVFVGLVSLALLFGFRWLTTNPYFSLREVTVVGNQRLDAEAIIAGAGVDLGANTLEIKIADVEERVAANPWVESAAVRRVLPSGLDITVHERTPRWWVHTPRGLFYAEADGAVIARVQPGKLTALPLLDVQSGGPGLPATLVDMTRTFDETPLPVTVTEAAWVRVLPDRLELFFEERDLTVGASMTDWERNMERLGAVWADLVRRGEERGVREIRIFGGKVWVRS